MADVGGVKVQRARLEEVRALAARYREELSGDDSEPRDAPLPQGGLFWRAEDAAAGDALGYAAVTLRPEGVTVGPVYVVPEARRRGVGEAMLREIQRWAEGTRVPVVEVSVAVDNDEGRRFLEAAGYRPRRILFSLRPVHDEPGEPGAGSERPASGERGERVP